MMESSSGSSVESQYYEWDRTLSYNADVTMVITARDRGKTFGIRMAAIDDGIRHGFRFVEVVRHKDELHGIIPGYFDKIAMLDKYAEVQFKTEGKFGYWRPVTDNKKEPWRLLCYFVALTEAQKAKKRTYARVRKIIFDEALIEPGTYSRYLAREWQTLANVVDTVTRETGEGGGVRPHLYMIGNAVSLVNPYFAAWGIDEVPPYGKTWYAHKTVLLDYEAPQATSLRRAETTLAGRMVRDNDEGRTALANEFVTATDDDIGEKTSDARFWVGLVYRGVDFGVWVDWNEGYLFVNHKIPSDARTVYSLTRKDNTANRLIARRASPIMKKLATAHYERAIRFDTISTREGFLDALSAFGIA